MPFAVEAPSFAPGQPAEPARPEVLLTVTGRLFDEGIEVLAIGLDREPAAAECGQAASGAERSFVGWHVMQHVVRKHGPRLFRQRLRPFKRAGEISNVGRGVFLRIRDIAGNRLHAGEAQARKADAQAVEQPARSGADLEHQRVWGKLVGFEPPGDEFLAPPVQPTIAQAVVVPGIVIVGGVEGLHRQAA